MQPPNPSDKPDRELLVIAGPCAIESEDMLLETAESLASTCRTLGAHLVFKSSYDKANRTSSRSARGLGLEKGLAALERVRSETKVPVLTDVHNPEHAEEVGKTVDVLQIPAFLCRQTDLVVACGNTGKPVNIKKGQFMAPGDMRHIAHKAVDAGASQVWLCERGTSFGYRDLIVDMRGLVIMRDLGYPVVFDATHSVQLPGAENGSSGGQRTLAAPLARAAVAVGVSSLFVETHPNPDQAISDPKTQIPLNLFEDFLTPLIEIDKATRRNQAKWLERVLDP